MRNITVLYGGGGGKNVKKIFFIKANIFFNGNKGKIPVISTYI